MIHREYYATRKDGVALYRTYTDSAEMCLRQVETGALYAEAIDVESAAYTYEETPSEGGADEEISDDR